MDKSLSQVRILAFDLEMTGLSPWEDAIVEIAGVPMIGGTPDGDYFYTPVQPGIFVGRDSKKIHGLSGDKLWNAPPIESVLPQFFNMMKGRILLGQNPSLDLAFLWASAKSVGDMPPFDWALDISRLFAIAYPDHKVFKLDCMAKRVGVSILREHHNAIEDALLVAKIFSRIMPKLALAGIQTESELVKAGKIMMRRL